MAKKLWGGRFNKKADPLVEKFTSSIHFDNKLALYDVMGSILHIAVLKEAGLISLSEYSKMNKGLNSILKAIKSDKFKADPKSEDIHSDIQNKLEKKIGKVALKLHTVRSRNDQIAFDTKLCCKNECEEVAILLVDLNKAIDRFAKKHKNTIVPGYTHLQHAQPVNLANHFSSYISILVRDACRILDSGDRISASLGSGALAGTNIGANKYNKAIQSACKKIGLVFGQDVCELDNSIDNVSDRDFVIETLGVLSIIGMHLSRLAEDLIIWSSSEFGFIELDDAFCTGSSLMPQKKNPDVLELIRGNTGKLYGNLTSVLVMMKGLPLSYNRDIQLDKQPLFSSFKVIKTELVILAKLIAKIKINKEKIDEQLKDESLYATDLAHYLVEKGVPFKQAHTIIGNLVKFSLRNRIEIKDLSDKQLFKFSKSLNNRVISKIFDPGHSVKSKKSVKPRR